MAEFGDTIDFGKTMLKIIETEYESIFSWYIKERTGDKQNLLMNFLDTIREKCDSFVSEKDVFNMNRFYYQLIIVYELYVLGDLKKSLQEVEIIVKSINSYKFDGMNNQYLDAYKHIAGSTYAYIALSMNCYSKKNIKNVKPINSLNQIEKSAICAIKACVFMEYAPNGNVIALQLANEARNLYSKEPHWIVIWLKAKGRCRRFNNVGKSMPDKDEIEAADILSSHINPKPQFLINACKIYHDVAFYNRIINDKEKSQMYFKLGSDLLIDASKLINNDVKEMYSCLFAFLFMPKEFQSKTAIEQLVEKLKTVNNNSSTNDVLGEYYFKYEKDYEKAKMYFSRGLSCGQFRCAMQLLKVECHLNPIDSFPYIRTLKMIYEVFPSPKRRLIILTQMILYYYDTGNPKELMYTLKLFLDQDIEDAIKKLQLINAQSFYNLHKEVKHNQFLNVLTDYVDYIRKNVKWDAKEKIVVDETCTLFSKISKFKTYGNQINKNNKTNFHQQCYEWRSEKKYFSPNSYLQNDKTRNNETSWRKKKENDNESAACNPFTKNANKAHEKHMSQKNKVTKYQEEKFEDSVNEFIVKRFIKDLTICNSHTTEANAFENQHGLSNKRYSNLHIPNSKNDSMVYEAETNRLNKKNRFQSRRRMVPHANKKKTQEQDNKGSFTINSNVHSSSSSSHLEVRNKIIYRSNNQVTRFKDEHNLVTN